MHSKMLGLILSIVFAPAVFFLSLVIFLATIGKTFGVRRLYIKLLLLIFEWGKQRIELHERQRSDTSASSDTVTNDNDETFHSEQNEQANGDITPLIARQTRTGKTRRMSRSPEEMQHQGFSLDDLMDFLTDGIEAIIEDEVTKRFDAAELSSWNLLTRTTTGHQFISWRLTILYAIGWILRYFVLFPFRAVLALFAIGSMIVGTAIVGTIPGKYKIKKKLNYHVSVTCYRIMSRAFSAVITFHNRENRAKGGGICVANHTSPIDIILLGCDNAYAMVGQAQGGFMGTMQRAFSRSAHHIWFQRSEAKDRSAVARRLREHVEDKDKLPILIFPEGTCINNTSIMMFKKGSFEVGGVIYPVAIKYDPRFADPFWNSSKQTLSKHLVMILTSWALVVDIWYLPPMTMEPGEDAVHFANRVKSEIARQGGLVDLDWDGGLKRSQPKPTMKQTLQAEYSARLKAD